MFEEYRLTLTHYAVNMVTGERFRLDLPIVTEHTFDRRYSGGSSIILNRLFDEMKSCVLEKMDEVEE